METKLVIGIKIDEISETFKTVHIQTWSSFRLSDAVFTLSRPRLKRESGCRRCASCLGLTSWLCCFRCYRVTMLEERGCSTLRARLYTTTTGNRYPFSQIPSPPQKTETLCFLFLTEKNWCKRSWLKQWKQEWLLRATNTCVYGLCHNGRGWYVTRCVRRITSLTRLYGTSTVIW